MVAELVVGLCSLFVLAVLAAFYAWRDRVIVMKLLAQNHELQKALAVDPIQRPALLADSIEDGRYQPGQIPSRSYLTPEA